MVQVHAEQEKAGQLCGAQLLKKLQSIPCLDITGGMDDREGGIAQETQTQGTVTGEPLGSKDVEMLESIPDYDS